jgi:hypothetical protein
MSSQSRLDSLASVAETARKQSMPPKATMKLHIDNHYRSKIYTTSSTISGHVEVNVSHSTDFDAIEIILIGTSRTSIDAVNIPRSTSHTFLKLIMPIPESYYPVPRRFEAGSTHTIPFHFVIPQYLTLNACSHCVPSDALKEHHLRLPPSVGNWENDDGAPHMSRITYNVRARALHEGVDGRLTRLMEASCEIKVLPLVAEEPPLSIGKQDRIYAMSKSKTLRKSILSSKLGKVIVSASQPAFAVTSLDGRSISPTTAHIDLEFKPTSSDSQPPKVTGVTSKVEVMTFYSSGAINQYPNLKDWSRSFGNDGRGVYTSTVSLPSATTSSCIDDIHWRQHIAEQVRRDSGYGSDAQSKNSNSENNSRRGRRDENRNSSKKSAPYYYSAKLRVPVQLPACKKMFLPTFHSCITSRVYVLWLSVSLSVAGGNNTNFGLRVPLQVGVGNSGSDRIDATGLPSFEAAMEEVAELEVDNFFHPRTISVPDVEFQSELPGYSERGSSRATQRV